jgi:HSP20 family protein
MATRREVPPQFEELFAELWNLRSFGARAAGYRPQVDCYRSDDPPSVTVVVDLPGIDPSDVEITVTERTVTIGGVRRRPRRERVSYRQMELEYGPVRRRVSLAEDVDPDRAEAQYERGQLTIVMPLAKQPCAGKIVIAVGDRGARP